MFHRAGWLNFAFWFLNIRGGYPAPAGPGPISPPAGMPGRAPIQPERTPGKAELYKTLILYNLIGSIAYYQYRKIKIFYRYGKNENILYNSGRWKTSRSDARRPALDGPKSSSGTGRRAGVAPVQIQPATPRPVQTLFTIC